MLRGFLFDELIGIHNKTLTILEGDQPMVPKILRLLPAVLPLLAFLSIQCQPVTSTEVGSPSDTQIPSMLISVDTTYISYSGTLVATGTVSNKGTSTITPPWYVECQFYTDSTFSLKMGGNNTQITLPLSSGQGTFWTISFSSSNVTVQNYPHFKVSNLRAVYKK